MTKTVSDSESLKNLRAIPTFVDYARAKMATDAEFWEREAAHGNGIIGTLAAAVVEIGGDEDGEL